MHPVKHFVVHVKRLAHSKDLLLPEYQTEGSSGMDLPAAVTEPLLIWPGGRKLIPTGFAISIPMGFEGQIRPRSGLALKYGVTVLNAPGTVDADYRGEVSVLLANFGDERFTVNRGDRVAQMVITPVVRASLVTTENLLATVRGGGGYGSTGHGNGAKEV